MITNKPSIPKGMRDFNSSVMQKRNYIFDIVKNVFECYSYAPIETPAMENLDTLTGKYGDEGDRLIFKVLNSGNYLSKAKIDNTTKSDLLTKQISKKALRYDLTVPFARFVAQNRNEIVFPFKRYQMQQVWRADKPQKGRYREFYQCDADVIGTDSLLPEIELIQLCDDVFTKLKIPNVKISINNRKVLSAMVELMQATDLFDEIVATLDKIHKIGYEDVKLDLLKMGLNRQSLNVLDTFLNTTNINNLAPLLEKSDIGKEGFEELQFVFNNINTLGLQSTSLLFDITLARGLNYYTGCIFEVSSNDVNIGSLAGGGRYDNLTSIFGLNGVSGVGISFGIDRIYLVMEELNLFPQDKTFSTKVMFVNFGDDEAMFCLPFLKQLRENGISSELYAKKAKIRKQMTYANNKGIKYVILLGEDEISSGILKVKNMQTRSEHNMSIKQLIKELK